jgi:hypothetical protein
VDGDATEQEPDDDELSEMETKETDEEEEVMEEKAYSVQEDGEQFWVVDDEGNLMAGPYASQEEADMNRYELESQAINYASHRVNGKSMPSLQQSIWDRMKAGEQVSVTDEDLDIIESYFQNNDDPDDSLVGYMASIPNPDGGGYLAFLKRSYSKDTFMEEDPMMIGDGDKDISEQVMLYDANTNKPLRPATPEEIEACQNSPSGMIDVGGALCCVKSFGNYPDGKSKKSVVVGDHVTGYVAGERITGTVVSVNEVFGYAEVMPDGFEGQDDVATFPIDFDSIEGSDSYPQGVASYDVKVEDVKADSIALKLIGLIADGKGKEMSASVRKMLGDRLGLKGFSVGDRVKVNPIEIETGGAPEGTAEAVGTVTAVEGDQVTVSWDGMEEATVVSGFLVAA